MTNRNFIGIDINPNALEITKNKLNFECDFNPMIDITQGDARNLSSVGDDSIDLICTHPPYANIIHYSEDIDGDMSLMGDTRKKGMVQPLAFETMRIFEMAGFKTKEIIIKEQHNCKATGYWKTNSIKFNFLLLAHEYLFVFKK